MENEFHIRPEAEKDANEIYHLVKTAFQTAKVTDGDEQDYVTALRERQDYIPGLSFVLEYGNEIIGHIMLTETFVLKPNEKLAALLLSPVCVKLEHRNRGMGTWLIRHSIAQAKIKGYNAIFLVGDPSFYKRIGFKEAREFDIRNNGDIPKEYVLCLELEKGFLGTSGGQISIL
jgi:putative acetyltransferase